MEIDVTCSTASQEIKRTGTNLKSSWQTVLSSETLSTSTAHPKFSSIGSWTEQKLVVEQTTTLKLFKKD